MDERMPMKPGRRHGLSRHNLFATYEDLTAARAAISALESRGIDAHGVTLSGSPVEEAAEETDVKPRDQRFFGHLAKRAIAGAIFGTIIGGVGGLVVAVLLFGSVVDGRVWTTALGAALALGALGGIWGMFSALQANRAFEMTYEPGAGEGVILGYHSDDADAVARAEAIIRETAPESLERRDEPGAA